MRRISTLSELKMEQRRLNSRRAFLEKEIKREFRELKEDLEPMALLGKSARKTLRTDSNHMISNSVGELANFIAKTTLKRSGLLSRLVIPYLLKNVTSNLVEKNKSKILNWIGGIASRVSQRKTLSRTSVVNDEHLN